jgi:hypothetical protein
LGYFTLVIAQLFKALGRQGAQLPLAIFSLVAALALVVGTLVAPSTLDRPVALGIAALLLLNGLARLVLWRNRAKLP